MLGLPADFIQDNLSPASEHHDGVWVLMPFESGVSSGCKLEIPSNEVEIGLSVSLPYEGLTGNTFEFGAVRLVFADRNPSPAKTVVLYHS